MSFDVDNTNRLIDRSLGGDASAFAQLFEQFELSLRQLCRRRIEMGLSRRFDLSDVIQETYVETLERFDDFAKRLPMSFSLWIRKNALERFLKLRRTHVCAELSIIPTRNAWRPG